MTGGDLHDGRSFLLAALLVSKAVMCRRHGLKSIVVNVRVMLEMGESRAPAKMGWDCGDFQ